METKTYKKIGTKKGWKFEQTTYINDLGRTDVVIMVRERLTPLKVDSTAQGLLDEIEAEVN